MICSTELIPWRFKSSILMTVTGTEVSESRRLMAEPVITMRSTLASAFWAEETPGAAMKATADRVERTALLSGDSRKDGDLFIGLLQGLIRKTNYVTFV